ncbi:TnsA endonuclease N-terminal domain-containing protein [Aneurinibacillus danicus]|uniref:TnsA endonuclease N-terminal domain-containing protein n=1 Tax=Aneurinibacillus danicus TaxID=267746 RepID=A0A511VD30_9BACL|nr:TnsA endonuclease N-terminal domain-containing protein [Aneurinibacillus danicus]GEN36739.1 hypothetical protein ADA01nite_41990 [Aneurinibacillus danicus]
MEKVRKINPSKSIHFRGKQSSLKNDQMIHWKSLLERDYIRLLEFDPTVICYESQPLVIDYAYRGKIYKYYPDFKIITTDHRARLVEVKPLKFINKPENRVKFEVGKRYCEQHGWTFQVVTEEQIRPGFLQYNLCKIRKIPKVLISKSICLQILKNLAKQGICTIQELREACNEIEESSFFRCFYFLIYHHKIITDLVNEKLSVNSLVALAKSEVTY